MATLFSAAVALVTSALIVELMVVTLASTSDLVYTSALLAFSERVFTIADTASSFEESLSAISPRVSRAAGAVPITSLIRLSTSVLVA